MVFVTAGAGVCGGRMHGGATLSSAGHSAGVGTGSGAPRPDCALPGVHVN